MDSTMLMLMMSKGGVSPDAIAMLKAIEAEKRERMASLVSGLGKIAVPGYHALKPTPKFVDETGKTLPETDPRYAGLLVKHHHEDSKKFDAFTALVEAGVQVALAYTKPSAMEGPFLASLASGSATASRSTAASARFGR